ncbi:MAG: hypothetical protein JEZ11_17850 [Desulfobacterales bacterium]|nr:hypothetical protein [Desulfobacterales bacterium]
MVKIVVMNGAARSGKDTLSKFIGEKAELPWRIHSTVETVKKAARVFGADPDGEKGDAERRLWSDLKDAYTRYNDGPFFEVVERVDALNGGLTPEDSILFVHAREPREIGKLKNAFRENCTTILLKRGGVHIPNNHADENVESFSYDLILDNSGSLSDLKLLAGEILEIIGIKPAPAQ